MDKWTARCPGPSTMAASWPTSGLWDGNPEIHFHNGMASICAWPQATRADGALSCLKSSNSGRYTLVTWIWFTVRTWNRTTSWTRMPKWTTKAQIWAWQKKRGYLPIRDRRQMLRKHLEAKHRDGLSGDVQPTAAPNGGPATVPGESGVTEGPPSVA